MERQIGIYRIVNVRNGHCYVGQSTNIQKRIKSHFYELRRGNHYNKYLQHAFNLYGEYSFKYEIIELCRIRDLDEREQYWIFRIIPDYNAAQWVNDPYHSSEEHEFDEAPRDIEFDRPAWHTRVYGGWK